MEQNIQKPSLPIKTKIAGLMMIIFGIVIVPFSLIFFFGMAGLGYLSGEIYGYSMLFGLLGLFLIILPPFLFKMKRWACWFSGIILTILVIIFLQYFIWLLLHYSEAIDKGRVYLENLPFLIGVFVIIILFLVPLLLLLLDRKNFFKVAT